MLDEIKNYISRVQEANTVFVLKGFSVSGFNQQIPDLETVLSNKVGWLMTIVQQNSKIISFDEFVCLYDMIISQFSKIYIIENPLFRNIFPIGVSISDEIIFALGEYFDEDSDNEIFITNLDEYTNIYSNFSIAPAGVSCCYNIADNHLSNPKIEIYSPHIEPVEITGEHVDKDSTKMNICDESDYFELIAQLLNTSDDFSISWDSYTMGRQMIEESLFKVNSYFLGRLRKVSFMQKDAVDNAEVKHVMENYWGYKEFRDIKIYDMDALAKKEKITYLISQGEIVGNLIQQAEKCLRGEDFRDIFVTAPTGAGKSLMFQLPAIYLAEKYNLVTLIISPLIGLMNDQVRSLEKIGYPYAKTINGDISPVVKQEILEDVKNGKCHILYLSPESLLARSDIESLIGTRRIGMLIVDEAHIVTTWGKQFRPDYWYLGDHVQKIFRAQVKKEQDAHGFVIATFTATAIYEGNEDMYHETLNSLHMNNPISYLGYVKRDNIQINVSEVEKKNKAEYELDKFDELIKIITSSLMRNKKTLIYFPTVALIGRFYDYCTSKSLRKYVSMYHGKLTPDEKDASFGGFYEGNRLIMLATKAFGMGIDIEDIAVVVHFAPTGNVCDYLQEIGRAAREKSIDGMAVYKHMSNDFKHINRLHGLSTIRKYQLVRVIEKILDLFNEDVRRTKGKQQKNRRELLIDTNNFAYIFESPLSQSDDSDLMSKVKTALLLIQKDYESRTGYSPFHMRPIPMFKNGYFEVSPLERKKISKLFKGSIKLAYEPLNICEIDLNKIWKQLYGSERNGISFPTFKYLLYTQNAKLDIVKDFKMKPAMEVQLTLSKEFEARYKVFISCIRKILTENARAGTFISLDELAIALKSVLGINSFQAEGIVNVVIAGIGIYQREFNKYPNSKMYKSREDSNTARIKYTFDSSIRNFFMWLDKGYKFILDSIVDDKIYVVSSGIRNTAKEISTILGILESASVLRFKSLGGSDSQIYMYLYTTKALISVRNRPEHYRNRLLELIEARHENSVKMLSYLFQSNFSSEEIWEHIENYFLGIIPEELDSGLEA